MFESPAGRNRKRPPAGLDPIKIDPVLSAASHVMYLVKPSDIHVYDLEMVLYSLFHLGHSVVIQVFDLNF